MEGLYTNLTGTLTKLVDTSDTINGKRLKAIHFGSGGFSGNQVVFGAEFSDGVSQSVAMATVSENRTMLRFFNVEIWRPLPFPGRDLRIVRPRVFRIPS